MNKAIYYFVLILFFGIGTMLKKSSSHEEMPIGCDEFGYLNLAKTIAKGEEFKYPLNRDYLPELLDTLRKQNISDAEINWMLSPHAYHIVPGTSQVVNQYPPGTSRLLSFFPISWRKISFPFIVMFGFILIAFLASRFTSVMEWNLFDLLFPLFLFVSTVSAPFTTEFARVNSLAPTFGLLLAAGMLLRYRPLLACFLIAFSINFRIVNGLMLIPVLLFLPFRSSKQEAWVRTNLFLLMKFGLLALIAILPLAIYNYRLLGNPFAITYSSIDTDVNTFSLFLHNLCYYMNLNNHWFRVHLIALISVLLLNHFRKTGASSILKLITFMLLNYLFFAWHKVSMDYYPYASAMILLGWCFAELSRVELPVKFRWASVSTAIIISAIVLMGGWMKYKKTDHISFEQAEQKYAALCDADIVWCDLYSGTAEYVCVNNGFRFATTTPRARKIVLKYLHRKQLSQLLVPEDIPMEEALILEEIKNAGLEYSVSHDPFLGKLILIPASTKNKVEENGI